MADNGHVNAVVIDVRHGRDGKLYPPRMPLPKAERNRLRRLIYNLHCRDGMSISAGERVIRENCGCPVQLVQLHADLVNFCCGLRRSSNGREDA